MVVVGGGAQEDPCPGEGRDDGILQPTPTVQSGDTGGAGIHLVRKLSRAMG